MGHSIFLNLSVTRGITHVWTLSPWARSALSGPGWGEARTSAWGLGCGYLAPATQTPRIAGASGREEGPAAGARHKVFRNTAGRPAKFAAGLTRKCR